MNHPYTIKQWIRALILAVAVWQAAGGPTPAWAQQTQQLRARELFYTPPPGTAPVPNTNSAAQPAPAPKPSPAAPAHTPSPAKVAGGKKTPNKLPPFTIPTNQSPIVEAANGKPEEAAGVPLGLRYSVLKRNAASKFEEVDPDATFHSGDRIRLEAQANTAGYLYVVAQGSSGTWQVLFPSREVAGGNNKVQRGETRRVPAGDLGQFVFDEQAGSERLFIVLSRQPETNLDKLIYSIGAPANPARPEPARVMVAQSSVGDDVISRIRGQLAARDLVFEKVENETLAQGSSQEGGRPPVETAAYVVNPSTASDARLVVDIKLKHQ